MQSLLLVGGVVCNSGLPPEIWCVVSNLCACGFVERDPRTPPRNCIRLGQAARGIAYDSDKLPHEVQMRCQAVMAASKPILLSHPSYWTSVRSGSIKSLIEKTFLATLSKAGNGRDGRRDSVPCRPLCTVDMLRALWKSQGRARLHRRRNTGRHIPFGHGRNHVGRRDVALEHATVFRIGIKPRVLREAKSHSAVIESWARCGIG